MDRLPLAPKQDWGHEGGGTVAPRDKEPLASVAHSEIHTRSLGIPNSRMLGIRMSLQVYKSTPYSHTGYIYYTITLRLQKEVAYRPVWLNPGCHKGCRLSMRSYDSLGLRYRLASHNHTGRPHIRRPSPKPHGGSNVLQGIR